MQALEKWQSHAAHTNDIFILAGKAIAWTLKRAQAGAASELLSSLFSSFLLFGGAEDCPDSSWLSQSDPIKQTSDFNLAAEWSHNSAVLRLLRP